VEKMAILLFAGFWPIFGGFFWQILPQLKTFSKNLSVCIILVLDATFVLVPNLMFSVQRYRLEKKLPT